MRQYVIDELLDVLGHGHEQSGEITVKASYLAELKELCLSNELVFHVFDSGTLRREPVIESKWKSWNLARPIRSLTLNYRTLGTTVIKGRNHANVIEDSDFRRDRSTLGRVFKPLYVEHIIIARSMFSLAKREADLLEELTKVNKATLTKKIMTYLRRLKNACKRNDNSRGTEENQTPWPEN